MELQQLKIGMADCARAGCAVFVHQPAWQSRPLSADSGVMLLSMHSMALLLMRLLLLVQGRGEMSVRRLDSILAEDVQVSML